jgi:hypothetical protein
VLVFQNVRGAGCEVELDDEPSIRNLIERFRKLGESPRPLDQLYTLAVDSELSDRLLGAHTQSGFTDSTGECNAITGR